MRRLLLLVALAIAVLAGTGGWLVYGRAENGARYRLAAIDEGPLVSAVSATGTLNAVSTIVVGSQLSGQIRAINADFNARVRAGDVLAKLDTDQIEARLRSAAADIAAAEAGLKTQEAEAQKADADLASARAGLASARAEVARAEALLLESDRDLKRRRELRSSNVASAAELEKAETAQLAARAQLAAAAAKAQGAEAGLGSAEAARTVAMAKVDTAKAQLAQRQAAHQLVDVDYQRSFIRAPIDGVVVQRNVEIGQTVAASLQAPTLFSLAEDLRRMEVWANVDEADIGRVAMGQEAEFTVAAFPAETFKATVKQIRLAPQTVQNVVTYIVVLAVDNPQLRLLPGMTATLRIIEARRAQVARLPNAALRWRPQAVAERRTGEGGGEAGAPRRPRQQEARVFVLGEDGEPKPVRVQLGASDGAFTEIVSGLAPGREVIVGGGGRVPAGRPAAPRLGF